MIAWLVSFYIIMNFMVQGRNIPIILQLVTRKTMIVEQLLKDKRKSITINFYTRKKEARGGNCNQGRRKP